MIPLRASLLRYYPERTEGSTARLCLAHCDQLPQDRHTTAWGNSLALHYSNSFLNEQPSFSSHLKAYAEGHLWKSIPARNQPPLSGSLQGLRAKALSSASSLAAAAPSTEAAISAAQDSPITRGTCEEKGGGGGGTHSPTGAAPLLLLLPTTRLILSHPLGPSSRDNPQPTSTFSKDSKI